MSDKKIPAEGCADTPFDQVKKGLAVERLVLPFESQADFEALLDAWGSEYEPASLDEAHLVVQLAIVDWRMLRVYRKESALFVSGLVFDDFRLLNKIAREEETLRKSFHMGLRALDRLRAERNAGPPKPPVKKNGSVSPTPQIPDPPNEFIN